MKHVISILILSILSGCVPLQPPTSGSAPNRQIVQKIIQYEDNIYETNIKTVQLTPANNTLLPAVTRIKTQSLRLSFDDLTEEADNYRVMLFNCNQNWKPSGLNSLEYLVDYNEFNITDYEFSFDTQTPYVHYSFDVPPITRSGNYILAVYRGDNKQDVILTKRVMIVNQLIELSPTASNIGLTNLSSFNQQINFNIRYPNYELENPIANVNITLRQNQRDGNHIEGLKPSFIREDLKELEYRFFDHQSTFAAANEYRFFDLRSLIYPGQNVKSVIRTTIPPKAIIQTDKPRTSLAYAEYNDANGQFNIAPQLNVNGQYTNVTFNLDCERIGFKDDAYLFGELTGWKVSDQYKLVYDATSGLHSGEVLLKQGHYEYQYLVMKDSVPEYYLEGNHAQSENVYEIFVYYKPYNERSDLLIGYYTTQRGGRSK